MTDETDTRGAARLYVREWAAKRDLNQKQLAERVGIEPGTLSKLLTGKMEMTLDYLGRISDALGLSLYQLFKEPGAPFSADDISAEDLKAAEVFSKLDALDKEKVLQIAVRLLPPSPEER